MQAYRRFNMKLIGCIQNILQTAKYEVEVATYSA